MLVIGRGYEIKLGKELDTIEMILLKLYHIKFSLWRGNSGVSVKPR
mgnify:CR=1 FL=1